MEKLVHPAKVTVGPQGRLVIPAELRREMSISSGDVLLAAVEGQRLVLEKREAVLKRLKRRFSHIPLEVSLADELIKERRAEARREERDRACIALARDLGRPAVTTDKIWRDLPLGVEIHVIR